MTRGTRLSLLCTCVAVVLIAGTTTFAERTLVDVIVAQNVKSELQPKLDRLADDLRNDGYASRITSWPAGKSARDVWNHLKEGYENDNLQGALLIGQIAIPTISKVETDMPYWKMSSYTTTGRIRTWNIWVGRFNGVGACNKYGDEVTLLSNALNANHSYRTGKSRYPHKAWTSVYDDFQTITGGMSLARTWADVAKDTWREAEAVPELCEPIFGEGGDIFNFMYHGHENGVGGQYDLDDVFSQGFKIRVAVNASCHTGTLGGLANSHLLADGSANIISIGSTRRISIQDNYILMNSNAKSCRNLLRNGTAWGPAMVEAFPFPKEEGLNIHVSCTMIYGDPSLRSNTTGFQVAPENHIPTVSLSGPIPGRPLVGEPAEFTATIHDADGDQLDVAWYVSGKKDGTPDHVTKNVSQGTLSFSYSYTKTGTFKPYVVVKDPWMTHQRSAEDIEYNVADPREQSLKMIVSALDPDLVLTVESTNDRASAMIDKAGTDQRHVWDIRPYKGRYRIYNNENGYGLHYDGYDEGDSVVTDDAYSKLWGIDTVGNGLYRIGYLYGHMEGLFITATKAAAGAAVFMQARRTGDAKLWRIEDYHGDATRLNQLTTETGNTRPLRSVGQGVLSVNIPRPGPVSVVLFTIHGRKVTSVRRHRNECGTVTVNLRNDAPAGSIHILRIDGNGYTRSIKIGLH